MFNPKKVKARFQSKFVDESIPGPCRDESLWDRHVILQEEYMLQMLTQ